MTYLVNNFDVSHFENFVMVNNIDAKLEHSLIANPNKSARRRPFVGKLQGQVK